MRGKARVEAVLNFTSTNYVPDQGYAWTNTLIRVEEEKERAIADSFCFMCAESIEGVASSTCLVCDKLVCHSSECLVTSITASTQQQVEHYCSLCALYNKHYRVCRVCRGEFAVVGLSESDYCRGEAEMSFFGVCSTCGDYPQAPKVEAREEVALLVVAKAGGEGGSGGGGYGGGGGGGCGGGGGGGARAIRVVKKKKERERKRPPVSSKREPPTESVSEFSGRKRKLSALQMDANEYALEENSDEEMRISSIALKASALLAKKQQEKALRRGGDGDRRGGR